MPNPDPYFTNDDEYEEDEDDEESKSPQRMS